MKVIVLFLFICFMTISLISQDYSQLLYEHNGSYRRVDSANPDVCFDDMPYWDYILEQSVIELNRAISVTANQGECHIQVFIIDNLNDKYPTLPKEYTGYAPDFFFDPRLVYIERNTPMGLGIALHELMHALGVYKHSEGYYDVSHSPVNVNALSDFDIALLQYLYSQEALEQSCVYSGC